jgi:serine/threonine protein kinase
MAKPASPVDFWQLLLESRLLAADEFPTLREQCEKALPAADATGIATWLGRHGKLTAWQARQLLKGRNGPFFLGDYRLLEQQKTPFRGRLFTARHEPSGRDVALVVLDSEACDNATTWEAIVQATQLATGVSDPVLSKTWALEQVGRRRLIVCERVEGTPLSEQFTERGSRPLVSTGELAFEIARAVAELHRHGIVHGAISLHTILETSPTAPENSPSVRLLQFPLAADPHLLPPRLPLASPQQLEALGQRVCFSAPELTSPGSTATATSDVYSLGCVLAALLTGSLPNWDGTVSGTLSRTQQEGLAALATDGLPEEVATAISYMTARDPLDRYPSAVDAAAAVAACFGLPEFPLDPPATAVIATEETGPQVTTDSAVATPASRRRRRAKASRSRRWQTIAVGLAAAVIACAGAAGIWMALTPKTNEEVVGEPPLDDNDESVGPEQQGDSDEAGLAAGRPQQLLDDDSLPWASPTNGLPPSLAYLPQGSQLMLFARPADLLASDEGERFLKALGPRVEALLVQVETVTGVSRTHLEELRIGWSTTADGTATAGVVVISDAPLDASAADARWSKGPATEQDGETVYRVGDVSYWQPTKEEGRVLVIGSPSGIEESLATDGLALVAPDVERLVEALDQQRQLTLIGSPSFLRNDGRLFLPKQLTPPANTIADLLGERTTVAAVSLFLGNTCYLEVDAVPTTAEAPQRLVDDVAERLNSLALDVEQRCRDLAPGYGGLLIGRLPGMLRVVAAELRWGIEDGLAVLNVHLPLEAAHNLALASELALAQEPGGLQVAATTAPVEPAAPVTIEDKLAQRVSLVFAKDTLEKSIEMLSSESGIPMEILGGDLQLEGITKNQSFGLDQKDQSVDAILRVILERANPDGKLVYVLRGEGDETSLAITTRAAVAKRGDTLPAGFEEP